MHNSYINESLSLCKNENLVDKIGVSVYTPQDVQDFNDLNLYDAIQIPINLFDHRLIDSGLLNELKGNNIIVFARSIFLQGLFHMIPEDLPSNLEEAKEPLQKLIDLSTSLDIPIGNLAFSFVRDLPGITSIVMGVDTKDQLAEDIELLNSPKLNESIIQEILDTFNQINENIVDPSKWNPK